VSSNWAAAGAAGEVAGLRRSIGNSPEIEIGIDIGQRYGG